MMDKEAGATFEVDVKDTDAYSGAIPQDTDPKGKVFVTAGFAAKIAVFKEV